MIKAVTKNLNSLKESGFSDQQAEVLLEVIQNQTDEIESQMLTKNYLDMQLAKQRSSLFLQTVGIVLSAMVLLGWFIDHLDTKARLYVDARFKGVEGQFKGLETRLEDFKSQVNQRFDKVETRLDRVETRFDRIESEIKEIKR